MVVLVVDDEKKARNLLCTILREYCDDISVILEAPNLMEGVSKIKEHQPDIVFMDIEMPDYLGIEIFDFLEEKEICFQLVFTTAYSHYAIKAFEINAIDYLLKPLRPNHVRKALQKATQQLSKEVIYQQLEALRASSNSNSTLQKIGIPVNSGILFVLISDIICLEADGMYTKIWLKNRKPTLTSKPLKHFIGILNESTLFYRVHRSFVINLHSVVQYSKKEGAVITLENEKVIPLSRNKKEAFLNLLNTNGIQLL